MADWQQSRKLVVYATPKERKDRKERKEKAVKFFA